MASVKATINFTDMAQYNLESAQDPDIDMEIRMLELATAQVAATIALAFATVYSADTIAEAIGYING